MTLHQVIADLPGLRKEIDERYEAELDAARAEAIAAVDEAHRSYRRDLVPVRQTVVRFDEASQVLRRLSGR